VARFAVTNAAAGIAPKHRLGLELLRKYRLQNEDMSSLMLLGIDPLQDLSGNGSKVFEICQMQFPCLPQTNLCGIGEAGRQVRRRIQGYSSNSGATGMPERRNEEKVPSLVSDVAPVRAGTGSAGGVRPS